jgi:hypothetical protein
MLGELGGSNGCSLYKSSQPPRQHAGGLIALPLLLLLLLNPGPKTQNPAARLAYQKAVARISFVPSGMPPT